MVVVRTLICLLALTCAVVLPAAGQGGRDDQRGPGRSAQGRGRPTEEERERSRVKLGITRDQQNQIEALYDDYNRQMRDIMGKLREAYKALHTLYEAYDYDKEQARRLRREIVVQRRRTVELHATTEDKLRTILNKEQFERMRRMMREERERMMRRGRPAPPG